jgi:hypothetical protein
MISIHQPSTIIKILAFPVVLTIGIILIPVVGDYTNHQIAEAAVQQEIRWFLGHIISAISFALSILASGTILNCLNFHTTVLTKLSLPMIAVGAGLYAAGLGADGIGPIAVQNAGYSPVIFFDGSGMWITGVFILATVIFGLGLLLMVINAIRLEFLTGKRQYISFISTLLFMIAPMILSGWALYGVAVAAFGIFVPLACAITPPSTT